MDGPTIAAATEAALRGGVRVRDALAAVEAISNAGGRAVVMTYWNLVLRWGVDAFARDLATAGGLGMITPDLIPDEADEWLAVSDAHDLDRIFLVAPSSTPERLAATVKASRGFVYAASTMGVTGARDAVSVAAPELVRRVKAVSDIPVGVGLGVRSREQAAQIGAYADGVIVGSALVSALKDGIGGGAVADRGTRRRRAAEDYCVTTTVLAYIPEPVAGCLASRSRPDPGVCAVHHRRHRRGAGHRRPALGERAAASAGSSTTSRLWAVPLRPGRRPAVPRHHRLATSTSATAVPV